MKWVDGPELNVPYYTFEQIDQTGLVKCAYTTRVYRENGKLTDLYQPRLTAGSDPEKVAYCTQLLADQFGADRDHVVHSVQKHTANIHQITEADLGAEENRPSLMAVDGLITDRPGVMLQSFGADCPSVYLLDPVHKAIGLCHSGRKGTQFHIAGKMLAEMERAFGTRPEDVLAAISPGICCDCYEVGDDVAEEFVQDYAEHGHGAGKVDALPENDMQKRELIIAAAKKLGGIAEIRRGRYHLDLNRAIAGSLEQRGVPASQIEMSDLCTRCRSDIFYSFRGQGCIINENCGALMLL